MPRACFALTSKGFVGIGNEFRREDFASVSPLDRLLFFILGDVAFVDGAEDDEDEDDELDDELEEDDEDEEEEDDDDVRFRLGDFSSIATGDNDG